MGEWGMGNGELGMGELGMGQVLPATLGFTWELRSGNKSGEG